MTTSRSFTLAKILKGGSKVSNDFTSAASNNVANAIVSRDSSGNFAAGTITAAVVGNASTATTLQTARTIAISGDITGNATSFNGSANITISSAITAGAIVNDDINASAAIADTKLATISTAGKVSNSATTATNANTASAIVARDASGNFSAGTITAALSGNASTATALASSQNFSLTGSVTAPAVAFNGSGAVALSTSISTGAVDSTALGSLSVSSAKLQANIPDSKLATISTAGKVSNSATTATNANTANAIVARDASGNFTAGIVSADQFNSTNNGNGTNYKVGDDAWIGDVNQANTIRITGQQDSSKGYIIFGNSNSTALGRSGTGDLTYGGVFSAVEFTSTNASGDEGGQVNLAKPPNATTSGGVTIDAFQNRVRIFENGGTARGVYFDLTAAAAGAGTNLLASTVNDGTLTLAVSGTGLSGSATFTANQASNSTFTVTSNATSANTTGAIVARDGSGNFSAGTITAALSGNASTATTLQTARTIAISGDVTGSATSFNGSADITISAGITAGSIVSADFSSATSLIIYNSAGTAVKTVYSPGS